MDETLDQMARALFKSWFVDFDPVRAKAEGRDPALSKSIAYMFPDTFEGSELGEIPQGWLTKPLSELADVSWGDTSTTKAAYVTSGYPKQGRRDDLAKRFKKATDPLRLVIVRDMWLTGFDVPSLHTMYVDKPMQGHALMQAIARVNRVFKDKPGGLSSITSGWQMNSAMPSRPTPRVAARAQRPSTNPKPLAAMKAKYEICVGLFPQAVADQLCALKEAHPTYSVALVIATARAQQRVPADLPLAPATVHRLLSRHGLMARPMATIGHCLLLERPRARYKSPPRCHAESHVSTDNLRYQLK